MTRINVIPVEELSDQHLFAEYRELPRCIKQDINLANAPKNYVLGKGHMKWAKKHSRWLMKRYMLITYELKNRGFTVNHPFYKLYEKYETEYYNKDSDNWYDIKDIDIELNRQRLVEKYNMKPSFYRWTNREKPEWLQ